MKAVKVTVSGRVTGVGFRWSAKRQANQYDDLRGWVRNCDSRTVQALVQGEEAAVDAMAAWLRHGPPGARVESCRIEPAGLNERLPPFHIEHF